MGSGIGDWIVKGHGECVRASVASVGDEVYPKVVTVVWVV